MRQQSAKGDGSEPAFRKMRLVDEATAIASEKYAEKSAAKAIQSQEETMRAQDKQVREYNPIIRAMSRMQGEMNRALSRRSDTVGRLAKYNASLSRMKALKSSGIGESFAPSILSEHATRAPPASVSSALNSETATAGAHGSLPAVSSVLPSIPKKYHNKYIHLHEFLSANPGAISASPNGRILVRGEAVSDATFPDVIRGLYVRTQRDVPGLRNVVQQLKEISVPLALISSPTAKSLYTASGSTTRMNQSGQGARNRQEHAKPRGRSSHSVKHLPSKSQLSGGGAFHSNNMFPGKSVKILRLY